MKRVKIDHSKVGPAARGDHATLRVRRRRVCRPGRVSSYGLFRLHPLFGIPAVRRLQAPVAPSDSRMQAVENVVIRSDQVGIEDQSRSVAPQGAPRVSSFDAVRPNTSLSPGFVLSAMRRLHRGDYAQLLEALKIVRVNDLRVLYAITGFRAGVFFSAVYPLDEIECRAIARVADGVNGDLEPAFHHFSHELLVETGPFAGHTPMPRFVRIVGQQQRAARAERAVVKGLD